MNYGQNAVAQQGQSNTSIAPKDVAPSPISPMQEARNGLANSVSFLHDRLGDLEQRLLTVLHPSGPSTANKDPNDVPAALPSELRSFLNEHTSGVRSAIGRIESLLERLEV